MRKYTPSGYVSIRREGDRIFEGTAEYKITANGEKIRVSIGGPTCEWVDGLKGLRPRESLLNIPNRDRSIEGKFEGRYVIMPHAFNYAKGTHELRGACEEDRNSPHPAFVRKNGRIYRPLTLGENLAARLQDESLFGRWLWSCTGIAYKGRTTLFKVIPECEELINISERFNGRYLKINYDDLEGQEFDSSKVRCNKWLNQEEARDDPLWLAALNYKKEVLNDNVKYVYGRLGKYGVNEGMKFFVTINVKEDQLKALSVDSLSNLSNANGNNNLFADAWFLRAAQF